MPTHHPIFVLCDLSDGYTVFSIHHGVRHSTPRSVFMNYKLPDQAPLTFAEAQDRVDHWIAQFEEGYFPSFIQLARLSEELGELARAVSYAEGAKKLKSTDKYEEVANVEEELGDLLLVLICFANGHHISLDTLMQKTLQKIDARDRTRWTPIHDPGHSSTPDSAQ